MYIFIIFIIIIILLELNKNAKKQGLELLEKEGIVNYKDETVIYNNHRIIKVKWDKIYNNISYLKIDIDSKSEGKYLSIAYPKDRKEYKRLKEIKDIILLVVDICDVDIEMYLKKINEANKYLTITKKSKLFNDYYRIFIEYKRVLNIAYNEVCNLKEKYLEYINEVFTGYELEEAELNNDLFIIDRNINYKNMQNNIDALYKNYKEYKEEYNKISNELENVVLKKY